MDTRFTRGAFSSGLPHTSQFRFFYCGSLDRSTVHACGLLPRYAFTARRWLVHAPLLPFILTRASSGYYTRLPYAPLRLPPTRCVARTRFAHAHFGLVAVGSCNWFAGICQVVSTHTVL